MFRNEPNNFHRRYHHHQLNHHHHLFNLLDLDFLFSTNQLLLQTPPGIKVHLRFSPLHFFSFSFNELSTFTTTVSFSLSSRIISTLSVVVPRLLKRCSMVVDENDNDNEDQEFTGKECTPVFLPSTLLTVAAAKRSHPLLPLFTLPSN